MENSHPFSLPAQTLRGEGPFTPCSQGPAPQEAFGHVPVGDSLWLRKGFFLFLLNSFMASIFPGRGCWAQIRSMCELAELASAGSDASQLPPALGLPA